MQIERWDVVFSEIPNRIEFISPKRANFDHACQKDQLTLSTSRRMNTTRSVIAAAMSAIGAAFGRTSILVFKIIV